MTKTPDKQHTGSITPITRGKVVITHYGLEPFYSPLVASIEELNSLVNELLQQEIDRVNDFDARAYAGTEYDAVPLINEDYLMMGNIQVRIKLSTDNARLEDLLANLRRFEGIKAHLLRDVARLIVGTRPRSTSR